MIDLNIICNDNKRITLIYCFRIVDCMTLLREIEVENLVRKYLIEHKFTVVPKQGIHGVNITADKNNVSHYIEVIGNKPPRENRPVIESNKYTHYFRTVGQLLLRISEHPDGKFILALPEDVYYRKKVNETMFAFRKLGVVIYFVTDTIEIVE